MENRTYVGGADAFIKEVEFAIDAEGLEVGGDVLQLMEELKDAEYLVAEGIQDMIRAKLFMQFNLVIDND